MNSKCSNCGIGMCREYDLEVVCADCFDAFIQLYCKGEHCAERGYKAHNELSWVIATIKKINEIDIK